MPPNLGGFFMVRSYYPSECHADYFDFERIEALKPAIEDRKSGSAGMPRPISYAVFCLKKKKILSTSNVAKAAWSELNTRGCSGTASVRFSCKKISVVMGFGTWA